MLGRSKYICVYLIFFMETKEIHEKEVEVFKQRTRKSREIFESNKLLVPYGVHSNYRLIDPYPLFVKRAQGSKIWDVDGNSYLDFNMGFGALVTGHAHPVLVEEMSKALAEGTLYGFETEEAFKLAKLITERFGLDMVRFSTTGLEATMHAIRIARAFTSREKILKFEGCYHGSHDSVLVSVKPTLDKAGDQKLPNQVPASKGVPESVVSNTLVAPFNDLQSTENILRKNSGKVAAVILEPIPMNMGFVLPEHGFLEGLRKLCDEEGCVLIFDEVKTSGKFYRGAAGKFNVKPDLMVLGKAIAGGHPLSVIGGKREIMENIVPGKLAHAGTFNSNPLSVKAGLITLSKILTQEAYSYLEKLGDELGKGYSDILNDSRIPAVVNWMGLSGAVSFGIRSVKNWRDFLNTNVGAWWTYYISMLNRGVIPCGTGPDEQWTISVQHGKEELQQHLETLKEVVGNLKKTKLTMEIVEAI
jgi:glutamate-1-semialdehyde 2,1-aminomutase